MLHWVIFFRTTVNPPRSDTPFTISSLAKTVPNPGHQFTSLSAKYVNLYCNKIFSCCSFAKAFHSTAEKTAMLSSQTAFTFAFPSFSKTAVNVITSSALLDSLLYQELNN